LQLSLAGKLSEENVHAAKLAVLVPPQDGKSAKLVMVEALCGHFGVIV
jgi:hypothetical protein